MNQEFPAYHAEIYRTRRGVAYLREPGVVLLAQPSVCLDGMKTFLDGFDPELGFSDYLNDEPIDGATALCKTAGQVCYLSFGPNRTKNKDADRYFSNIKSSGHGSVLEHANFSFLFYGIDRSVTHELVRHRAGFGFSQVSQRYVDGKVLRFVERPEYVNDVDLHFAFEHLIEELASEYNARAQRLMELQSQDPAFASLSKTDRRKRVNQAARSCLPNEAEAPIVVTGNVRAWRHFIEMRCSQHADVQIRNLAARTYLCLKRVAPVLFSDYAYETLTDGMGAISTPHRKV